MNKAIEVLKKYWGFDSFRSPQEEIIKAVLAKKDVFVLLPTGAGKSLCYQIPALLNEGVCLVISPLIALMEDQVTGLQQKGIKAMALSAKLNRHETIIAFDNLAHGAYKFLYLSPEKLQSEFIQEKIAQLQINLIAIDEVHCVSQWGHDFRPAYLQIPILNELQPNTPKIALTATATSKVIEDITDTLNLSTAQLFKTSYFRENLCINMHQTENIRGAAIQLLKSVDQPSIIYVGSRTNTVQISRYLQQHQIPATYYHGGLSHDEKSNSLEQWKSETSKVMVATNAFGMGIDKSNVRLIIHMHIPYSIENYIQEIGRAGRDGKKSWTYLLYNKNSFYETKQMIDQSLVSAKECLDIYSKLNDFLYIGKGEYREEPFQIDLQEFSIRYKFPYRKVYNAIQHLQNEHIISVDQGLAKVSKIKIIERPKQLLKAQERNDDTSQVLHMLLRSYGGILDQFININENFLAQKLNKSKQEITNIIQTLAKDERLKYDRSSGLMKLNFLVPREDNFIYHSIKDHIENRNKTKIRKAIALENMITNDNLCRQRLLLDYFSENLEDPCGKCDTCKKINSNAVPDKNNYSQEILNLLRSKQLLDINEISLHLSVDKKLIIKTLEILVEQKRIGIDLQNNFYIKE
ncbi:RecQ family ATP-dependent DNA helicase [Lutimonas sp.]|uniref:RecQ family ATP-dependent DNA helicase n=1 Tax=Lutimonas sp. TaxID=1872403 RepID=UPI003D9BF2E4